MKRERFIYLTSVGLTSILLPVSACQKTLDYPDTLSKPPSLSRIWSTDTIRSIGNAYRKKNPTLSDKRQLVKVLARNIPSDTTQVAEVMNKQIQRDFKSGNTVIVNGWILSQTEAQQCALFSLEPRNK